LNEIVLLRDIKGAIADAGENSRGSNPKERGSFRAQPLLYPRHPIEKIVLYPKVVNIGQTPLQHAS
jgi:hypothetical protein